MNFNKVCTNLEMKEKKARNEIRSLSPNYVNFLVHTKFSPQDDKEIKKVRAKNREDKKVSGIFNHSKMSNSSRGSMQRSRSNNQLPIISGSDLRTIKEIFEMAKESKIKQSLHRIPIKRLPKSNIIVDKRRKIKSIPKPKKSSISLAPLNYYICNLTMLFEKICTKYINFLYKVNNLYIDNNTKILNDYPKEEQIILQSTPSKQSSTTTCDRNQDIAKFYSNCIIESCPQLPQISHKNLDSSNKKDNKKKHYSKFKYQIRVIIDKNGNETSCITKQKIIRKKKKKLDKTKNIISEDSNSVGISALVNHNKSDSKK